MHEIGNQSILRPLTVVSKSLQVEASLVRSPVGGGGGVLPYITYTGMCRPTGS